MLTKDLLHFRVRQGRVHPVFADVAASIPVAAALLEAFAESDGQTVGELESVLAESPYAAHPLFAPLKKLLLDRCDEAEDESDVVAERWRILDGAQELRRSGQHPSLSAFQEALATKLGKPFAAIGSALYADLPEFRRLEGFKPLSPESLLCRYNCALVQGILLRARRVSIKAQALSLAEKRRLFRHVKFHQLLAEVDASDERLTIELSGPLSLFENSQSYGMRLANFFPHVLFLGNWTLEAEVKLKEKDCVLKLDHTCGLKSHYSDTTPVLPEDLQRFMTAFNERTRDWKATPSEGYLHLGKQSYCFPDLTFTGSDKRLVHLELFHKWHASQLQGRLRALEANAPGNLMLGVAKALQKDAAIAELLEKSPWFQEYGFLYAQFPLPQVVAQRLAKRYPASAKASVTL